jgi:hypothetical protein
MEEILFAFMAGQQRFTISHVDVLPPKASGRPLELQFAGASKVVAEVEYD